MPEGSQPAYEIALAHFIVSDDVERSRRFYTEVLGGKTIRSGEPTYVALANSWIIINLGGGPTDDKPAVTLETPRDADLASSFLNIRVSDIHAVYAEWSARGAEFLTPLGQHDLTSGLVVAQVAGEQARHSSGRGGPVRKRGRRVNDADGLRAVVGRTARHETSVGVTDQCEAPVIDQQKVRTRQPVVQGRSFSGLRMAQMCLIRPPVMSNASTVTVTPSCWATRPGWPLTVRSKIVRLDARLARSAR